MNSHDNEIEKKKEQHELDLLDSKIKTNIIIYETNYLHLQ